MGTASRTLWADRTDASEGSPARSSPRAVPPGHTSEETRSMERPIACEHGPPYKRLDSHGGAGY